MLINALSYKDFSFIAGYSVKALNNAIDYVSSAFFPATVNQEIAPEVSAEVAPINACTHGDLNKLLGAYAFYSESDGHSELIAVATQVIVEDYYNEEMQDILSPITDYWHDVIFPNIAHYMEQNSEATECASINHYPC